MGPFGVRQDARSESVGVVRAQDRRVEIGEGDVDERLVPGCLDHLRRVLLRPDRLAHEPAPDASLELGPVPDLRDDPPGIATELVHVEKANPLGRLSQSRTQRVDLLARDRDHQRLAGGVPGAQEIAGGGQVLVDIVVEERPVLAATGTEV